MRALETRAAERGNIRCTLTSTEAAIFQRHGRPGQGPLNHPRNCVNVRCRRKLGRTMLHLSVSQFNPSRKSLRGSNLPSFDHLVGNRDQRGWNGQPQGFGRLEIDHQLELGRLFDR